MFVFVIMIIAATKPIIDIADKTIRILDSLLPLKKSAGFLVSVLIIGPLLGLFITEPAAMTVSAPHCAAVNLPTHFRRINI